MEAHPISSSDQSWYKPRGYAQAMNPGSGNNASDEPLAHQSRSKLTKAQVGRAESYSPGSNHTRTSDNGNGQTMNIKRPEASYDRKERKRRPDAWDYIPLDDHPRGNSEEATRSGQRTRQEVLKQSPQSNHNANANGNTQGRTFSYYVDPQEPDANGDITRNPVQQEQTGYPRTNSMALTEGGGSRRELKHPIDQCYAVILKYMP
ncbi:hypothetical protein CVT26_007146 [Gymnopilus dilepis]|uniref:Uncharacterized protein n=1 Tax=Gymnopilus dilepis TaxID=231916 RepID=A0A409W6L1_9AGAR|nr:hypothetical protein CVT26_007146 [Gymnopilus dilepis]